MKLSKLFAVFTAFLAGCAHELHARLFSHMARTGAVQGLVSLNRAYAGYAAGTIVQLGTVEEAAVIASGIAVDSAGPVTAGAVSTLRSFGRVGIPIGASSVVVTCPIVTANSHVYAVVAQDAADATLLRVERILPAAGSFTIYGTANATAAVAIDWAVIDTSGGMIVS